MARTIVKKEISNERDVAFPTKDGWNAWGHFISAFSTVADILDKRLQKEHRLSLTEYGVMYLLHRFGGRQRCVDLARGAFLTQSRVTRHLDKLEKRGFTRRETTPTDRRVTYAVLTPAGEKAYEEALVTFAAAYEAHFAALIPEEDRATFVRTMLALGNQQLESPRRKTKRSASEE